MVLVDLRKAFDLVDHELMLMKLDMYGCQGNELAWFKSYLSERFQSVKYDGVLSDPLPVTVGVGQGSILGPLLFITFMNDSILEISDMRFDMYADDSTLYTAGKCVGDINRSLSYNEVETAVQLARSQSHGVERRKDRMHAVRDQTKTAKCKCGVLCTH